MIVGIVGSRELDCYDLICEKMPIGVSEIVSGGANGVDTLARKYANENKIHLREILPDYKTHGKRAPLVRNLEIVSLCDYVLVFWNGVSNGSKNTIKHCLDNDIPVKVFVV